MGGRSSEAKWFRLNEKSFRSADRFSNHYLETRDPRWEMKLEVKTPDTVEGFRRYDADSEDPIQRRVRDHYRSQHLNQTVEFVRACHTKWLKFSHAQLSIMECLKLLSTMIDESDPDVDEANLIHAFQTAERMRFAYPERPWMHLTGLIHDLGKVMSVWGEPQWAVSGDTYPVGCRPVDSVVYGIKSFDGNADLLDSRYSSQLGMYKENCGLENLLMVWSHDEYLYRVLRNHPECKLPDEALYAIRFHSFYPYHSNDEYLYFQNERDKTLRHSIDELNGCDLYSKADESPDIPSLQLYYQQLIDEYIPGILAW